MKVAIGEIKSNITNEVFQEAAQETWRVMCSQIKQYEIRRIFTILSFQFHFLSTCPPTPMSTLEYTSSNLE